MSMTRLGRMLQGVELCSYGISKELFRGPAPNFDRPFIAFVGGTETLGPYHPHPYPSRVGAELGVGVLNLGIKNAGFDVFLRDKELLRAANHAEALVLETLSPANQSNAYYRVHPRRNDRVVEVMGALRRQVPGLDTGDIHFTGHLLRDVAGLSRGAWEELRAELHLCWVERLSALVERMDIPVHMIHLVDRRAGLSARLIDGDLLRAAEAQVDSVTTIHPSMDARAEGTTAMSVLPEEAPMAAAMLSTAAHVEIAEAVAAVLAPGLGATRSAAKAG